MREPEELAAERAPGAINIPLAELRARLGELPRDREILVACHSGVVVESNACDWEEWNIMK